MRILLIHGQELVSQVGRLCRCCTIDIRRRVWTLLGQVSVKNTFLRVWLVQLLLSTEIVLCQEVIDLSQGLVRLLLLFLCFLVKIQIFLYLGLFFFLLVFHLFISLLDQVSGLLKVDPRVIQGDLYVPVILLLRLFIGVLARNLMSVKVKLILRVRCDRNRLIQMVLILF